MAQDTRSDRSDLAGTRSDRSDLDNSTRQVGGSRRPDGQRNEASRAAFAPNPTSPSERGPE